MDGDTGDVNNGDATKLQLQTLLYIDNRHITFYYEKTLTQVNFINRFTARCIVFFYMSGDRSFFADGHVVNFHNFLYFIFYTKT